MSQKINSKLISAMDSIVRLYVLASAMVLMLFMVSIFVYGTWGFFTQFDVVLNGLFSVEVGDLHNEKRHSIEASFLHFFAFEILLIKAYRILISYARTYHINIKYLVEIAIIAATIEIFFNAHAYKLEHLILFGVFGIANLIIYVWKFDQFKKIGLDKK